MGKMFFAIILVFVLILFFGCTQTDNQPITNPTTTDTNYGTITQTDSNDSSAGLTHNVRIANLNYNPIEITINVGDTVSWRNEESSTHTVTSDIGIFDSEDMGMGVVFEQRFLVPGIYSYHCSYHQGMNGKVIVQ